MIARMLVARMPDGLYKLSRDSLLIADLPGLFTTKTNWRGSLPRDILCAFCRQHRLSEPVFDVVCNSNKSDHDSHGSCSNLSTEKLRTGVASKTRGALATIGPNSAKIESFSCGVKVFSKNHNLILESSRIDTFMKQGDAVQNASLRVLSFLNLYFKQPNMTIEELCLLGADCDIQCHSTCFMKEFSLCQLLHKVQQPSHLRGGHKLNTNHRDPSNVVSIFENKQWSIQGAACGSLPSNGSLVSISYSVILVSKSIQIREILEKSDEFEFEIGIGAVISCIEAAVLQMTAGQSVCFYLDMPQTELVLAATMDCEKVLSFLSSSELIHFSFFCTLFLLVATLRFAFLLMHNFDH